MVGAVVLFSATPDMDELIRRITAATVRVPALRLRRRRWSLPVGPRWEVDPGFDIAHHVRRGSVTPDTSPDDLLAAAIESVRSESSHPPWQVVAFDGLPDGRGAVAVAAHGDLMVEDGGFPVLAQVVDNESQDQSTAAHPAPGAVRHDLTWIARTWRSISNPTMPSLRALNPITLAEVSLGAARSWIDPVNPSTAVRSVLFAPRSQRCEHRWLNIDLGPIRTAAHRFDATVNDALLAGVTGGLRAYHDHHRVLVGRLRTAMPTSTPDPASPTGHRNRVVHLDLPIWRRDPVERLHEVGSLCRAALDPRTRSSAPSFGLPMQAGTQVDLVINNVPGFPEPVRVAGSEVTDLMPLAPTNGAALSVTLVSYAGRASLGVSSDPAAVTDPDLLITCIAEAFEEISDLAPPVTATETGNSQSLSSSQTGSSTRSAKSSGPSRRTVTPSAR